LSFDEKLGDKKRARSDLPSSGSTPQVAGDANHVSSGLAPIPEAVTDEGPGDAVDHFGAVEFDLLDPSPISTIIHSSEIVSPYFEFTHPMGSVCHASSMSSIQSLSSDFQVIIDSGCTKHMFPHQRTFLSYNATPQSLVTLADKSRVPCLGVGDAIFKLGTKTIILSGVLHVPTLRNPLLSVRCFRRMLGCSFLADNAGCFISFPTFFLPIDDSTNCIISGFFSPLDATPDFDGRLHPSASAVSDNTHHKASRRPVVSKKPSQSHDNSVGAPSPPSTSALPTVSESNPSIGANIFADLNLSSSDVAPSSLSEKQIVEISTPVVNHLKKRGRITTDLLHFLQGERFSRKPTSTTPPGRPVLLSSDKMSSTAVAHARFSVQQLSHYFGFRSLKKWEALYDVCQDNFSIVQPSESPLELGHVANLKKARSNKTPVERPKDFLEVVHCDIGYGDVKGVGNGALYCLTLVDRAT
jgi:hypothetical protein